MGMAEERQLTAQKTAEFVAECEARMGSKEAELSKMMDNVRAKCEQKMQKEKEETAKKAAEFREERERLEQEKVAMAKNVEESRKDFERKLMQEEGDEEEVPRVSARMR